MKTKKILLACCLCCFIQLTLDAQLDIDAYTNFRQQVENLTYDGLESMYARPADVYYKGYNNTPDLGDVAYFDSVNARYSLTPDEIQFLKTNHFFVTERLYFGSFDAAFADIFINDLPVFISTDAILHVLHLAYDKILKQLEMEVMSANLEKYVKDLYDGVPLVVASYQGKGIDESLKDLDLYVSVAYSLITAKKQPVRIASASLYDEVMAAIAGESVADVSLFCSENIKRTIDFSQFKVRGHYVFNSEDAKSLEPYFRAMMWLGRIDLYLTSPEATDILWTKEDIRRMNISSFLLNNIHQNSEQKSLFEQNETIINYMVGKSDNITLDELNNYLVEKNITHADDLLNDSLYDPYYEGLSANEDFQQKIMGGIYFVDPSASEPSVLPISFLMAGQRFIIDSEVLSNVVFDRIIYNGHSQLRLMPDPLDALFSLGNNDAAYFLQNELETYHYAANLAQMRYLIDSKEEGFWQQSLYNAWLNAIRKLNPADVDETDPFFMQTSAWHQQKMNTQLASWTELRHDNLLYAKPSYTGGMGCSYPFSYVEPYPEFYASLADFCRNAGQFFSGLNVQSYYAALAVQFFPKFADIMDKLNTLAIKELNNEPFTNDENNWLKTMLVKNVNGECGTPPYSGWFYDLVLDRDDFGMQNYITVDLHTQPTDSTTNVVGKVLHTGVGAINLGTFLIKPSGSHNYVAFTGPFMSYYEKITQNFYRMTDEEWTQMVYARELPARPEWTQAYLVNSIGNSEMVTTELPNKYLVSANDFSISSETTWFRFYPNPVTHSVVFHDLGNSDAVIQYEVIDFTGKQIARGVTYNNQLVHFSNLPKGLYLLKVESSGRHSALKIVKD